MSRCVFFQGQVYRFLQNLNKGLRPEVKNVCSRCRGQSSRFSLFNYFFFPLSLQWHLVFLSFLRLKGLFFFFFLSFPPPLCFSLPQEPCSLEAWPRMENWYREVVLISTGLCCGNWGHSSILGVRPCILKHLPLVRKLRWHLSSSPEVLLYPSWARRDLDTSLALAFVCPKTGECLSCLANCYSL